MPAFFKVPLTNMCYHDLRSTEYMPELSYIRFGKNFGNYNQDIKFRVFYEKKRR